MRTREIEVGKAYQNSKGWVRVVVDEGEYLGQDVVVYLIAEGRRASRSRRHTTTRSSFASWAKHEVENRCDYEKVVAGGREPCTKTWRHDGEHRTPAGFEGGDWIQWLGKPWNRIE